MLDHLIENVADKHRAWKAAKKHLTEHTPEIQAVLDGFPLDKIVRVEATTNSIDLYVAGDAAVLNTCFATFRRLQYEPTERPTENMATYCSWFRRKEGGCQFWFNFTGTHCKRVKVGTKTQEIDIYETICKGEGDAEQE